MYMELGLGISLSAQSLKGGGAAGTSGPDWRFVTDSVSGSPKNKLTMSGTGGTTIKCRTKIRVNKAVPVLWFGFYSKFLSTSTGLEVATISAAGINMVFGITDSTATGLVARGQGGPTFNVPSGNTTFTYSQGGANGFWTWIRVLASDLGLVNFAADTIYWLKHEYTGTSATDEIAIHDDQAGYGIAGENTLKNQGTANSVDLPGSYSTGGASVVAIDMRPVCCVGQHQGVSDLMFGDSNGWGQGSVAGGGTDNGEGNGGYYGRAHWLAKVPYAKFARQGMRVQWWANAQLFFDMLPFVTDVDDPTGSNDIGSGSRTAAQIKTDKQAFYAAIHTAAPWIRIHPMTILIRCTSSPSSFVTAGDQIIQTNFVQSGSNTQYVVNNEIRAGTLYTGAGIAPFVDLETSIMDASFPGQWKVNGTTSGFTNEGTHLSSPPSSSRVGHQTYGAALQTVVAARAWP